MYTTWLNGLKANPKENITIVGYADKNTGTAEYNMALSRASCQRSGQRHITNQYGIDAKAVSPSVRLGSDVQPYSTNDWNRIVIFTSEIIVSE